MHNILDIKEKKKILTEYRVRLAVVFVFMLSFLVVASLVLLVSSYLLAVSKYNSTEKQLATIQEKYSDGRKGKDVTAQISEVNSQVALFLKNDAAGTELPPPKAIASVLSAKSATIKISGIMYDATVSQGRIVLTGVARDRESMAVFVETLKSNPLFTNVTLPISSYVKSENIDFSVVVEFRSKAPVAKK